MAPLIILIVLVIVVLLVVKAVVDVQQQKEQAGGTRPTAASVPQPAPRHPSRWRAAPSAEADTEDLAEHVKKLREAIEEDLVEPDEAVASLIRHAGGQLSETAARRLLDLGA